MEQIIATSSPKTIFPDIREPETQHISAMVRSFLVAAVIAPLGEASKIPVTLPSALDTRRLFCAMCPGDGPNHI